MGNWIKSTWETGNSYQMLRCKVYNTTLHGEVYGREKCEVEVSYFCVMAAFSENDN
jgi:hypothetical protein